MSAACFDINTFAHIQTPKLFAFVSFVCFFAILTGALSCMDLFFLHRLDLHLDVAALYHILLSCLAASL